MQVTFKRAAFIGGVRYRQGPQDYVGDVADLPKDALIDGKPVGDFKGKQLEEAKADADKAEAALAEAERKAKEKDNDLFSEASKAKK